MVTPPAPDHENPYQAVLLYDGFCGFCDATVRWLIQHDPAARIAFAPQQSAFAQTILARHHIHAEARNTVYLLTRPGTSEEKILKRSDAILYALILLGGSWKFIAIRLRLLPRILRDAVYAAIARIRYSIAGRLTECRPPTAAERSRFLGL